MYRFIVPTLVAAALIGAPAVVHAQDTHTMEPTRGASVEWTAIQPDGFDAGMELAVLKGDLEAADQPYTIRLRFRDGYRFPAHFHPRAENLTVLSGTFLLSMGTAANGELTEYVPGDFLHIPAQQPHYGGARGETVVQLHGEGPFEIVLATPPGGGAAR